MGVLQRFERRLEGMVEGAFAKVFKGDVQPVEIAAALQRETDDRKAIVGQGRVLVPNEFTVELGSRDYSRLSPYAEALGDELAAMVREHAQDASYTFVGPVKVGLEEVDDVDPGAFRIRSGVAAGATVDGGVVHNPAAEGPQGTEAVEAVAPDGALRGNPRLTVTAGGHAPRGSAAAAGADQAYFLTAATTTIGRGPENDLRINDPGVSRRHATIRRDGDALVLEDIGSTNGTLINDNPISRHSLRSGDRIAIGNTTLTFDRDED